MRAAFRPFFHCTDQPLAKSVIDEITPRGPPQRRCKKARELRPLLGIGEIEGVGEAFPHVDGREGTMLRLFGENTGIGESKRGIEMRLAAFPAGRQFASLADALQPDNDVTLHDIGGQNRREALHAVHRVLAREFLAKTFRIPGLRGARHEDQRCHGNAGKHAAAHSTRTEVSSATISSMRSRSGIHGASLIMRTWEMMGVRSGNVLVGSGRRMSALTRTNCGKPCDTMP